MGDLLTGAALPFPVPPAGVRVRPRFRGDPGPGGAHGILRGARGDRNRWALGTSAAVKGIPHWGAMGARCSGSVGEIPFWEGCAGQ